MPALQKLYTGCIGALIVEGMTLAKAVGFAKYYHASVDLRKQRYTTSLTIHDDNNDHDDDYDRLVRG